MTVEDHVIEVFKDYTGDESVTSETTFESLGIDSLDLIEMIMNLEERLEMTIPEEDVEDCHSVGELAEKVNAKSGCES